MRIITMVFSLCYIMDIFGYQYEISICCITQNEDRFLKEWVDYHQMIGVEHFYIYDNLSTDRTRQILDPYIASGVVEYLIWDKRYDTAAGWWKVQCDAYIDAVERAKHQSKWLCIIDTDEFIVPTKDLTLNHFLKDFECYGGVCLNWLFFGTSGIERVPDERWITTSLLLRAALSYPNNHTVKSIVQPERVNAHRSFFPHTCTYIDGFFQVNANKVRFKGESTDICIDRIRLHHYWCRDIEFLMKVKLPRYIKWYGMDRANKVLIEEEKMNKCYDDSIPQLLNKLKNL